MVKTPHTFLTSVRLPHDLRQRVEELANYRNGGELAPIIVDLLREGLNHRTPETVHKTGAPAFSSESRP